MAKRKLKDEEAIAQAEDSNDSDYGPPPTSARRKKASKKLTKKPTKKPAKRRRTSVSDLSDDEVDESELEYQEEVSPSPPVLNPKTGRPLRKVTRQAIYEEPSDPEVELGDESDQSLEDVVVENISLFPSQVPPKLQRRSPPPDSSQASSGSMKPSLIIKLATSLPHPSIEEEQSRAAPPSAVLAQARPSTRPRSRSTQVQGSGRKITPAITGVRRSARLSQDPEEPMIALSNSGKHSIIVRPGTRSPEPEIVRASTAGKAPRKGTTAVDIPSAIMEDSAEQSQIDLPKQEVETQVPESVADTDQPAIETAERGSVGVEKSVHDEDGTDDEPINQPGRSARGLQPRQSTQQQLSQKRKRDSPDDEFTPSAENDEDDSESSVSYNSTSSSGFDESTDGGIGRDIKRRKRNVTPHGSNPLKLSREMKNLDKLNKGSDFYGLTTAPTHSEMHSITYERSNGNKGPSLRPRSAVDYRIYQKEKAIALDELLESDDPAEPPRREPAGAGTRSYNPLFSTAGPFGGNPTEPLNGQPAGTLAIGGIDSDSSDDDDLAGQKLPGVGTGQTHGAAASGGPANFGKFSAKDKKLLADADPLGVDPNLTLDDVGGFEEEKNQLKEMVTLPLLYPEPFKKLGVIPPRGVLFHGPPGTGKTLMVRALANDLEVHGRRIAVYVRKGADALSKWVGEAERQLRILFEEAKKNAPAIIFFDEFDALAPVRSSKQEQIHATIVGTLLALMDGMDGRGQVIIIGATNRPDNIDPAFRRPGRFDRELYFGLPNLEARKAIIDIHTKSFPPIARELKDQLAEMTNGFSGADLRSLCTEAMLNAIQGTYPQIYASNQKLLIDPDKINVSPKDFMISLNNMISTSERTPSLSSSARRPLSKSIEPLLRKPLAEICQKIDRMIPRKRKLTALEEAEYDDREDEHGFQKWNLEKEFNSSRIYRPRILIGGLPGMGQQDVGNAILHRLEDVHVQSFDLPAVIGDPFKTPEAVIAQFFLEARSHKASVIYIPEVNEWYQTLSLSAITVFMKNLKSVPPNNPILLLGTMEMPMGEEPDPTMLRAMFGFSKANQYNLRGPDELSLREFWENVIHYIRMKPDGFPNPESRKKRKLNPLPLAPPPPEPKPRTPTRAERKQKYKREMEVVHTLKLQLQRVMDEIKKKYRRFRNPVVPRDQIQYLDEEQDQELVTTDLPLEQRQQQGMLRPYERTVDKSGHPGIRETPTGKFYYNLDIDVMEQRLANGYYKRTDDFLRDAQRILHDSEATGDLERIIKAREMVTNVIADMAVIETNHAQLVAECREIWAREKRGRKALSLQEARVARQAVEPAPVEPDAPPATNATTDTARPIFLGEPIPDPSTAPSITPAPATTTAHHIESNGSTVPSKPSDDIHKTDSQNVSPLAQSGPVFITPSGPLSQQKSQRSAHQTIPYHSLPAEYRNSASTTTSGQKTSHPSSVPSNAQSNLNTQSTNGIISGHVPDLSSMMPGVGDSELPDTQEWGYGSSQGRSTQHTGSDPSQASQPFTIPGMTKQPALPLQAPNMEPPQPPSPQITLDQHRLSELLEHLIHESSHCSIEELQQVRASVMRSIWDYRVLWDRNQVVQKAWKAFDEIIEEIQKNPYLRSV